MVKFIFKSCKSIYWMVLLVILCASLSSILGQYMYKITGYMIDYGLNFSCAEYDGLLSFIFDGRYGTIDLMIILAIIFVACATLSSLFSYLNSYIQMKCHYRVGKDFRFKIYNNFKGKKLPLPMGDFLNVLYDDIYQPAVTVSSYYTGVFSSFVTIVFSLLMLNTISPYLLIAPVVMTPLLIYYSIKYHKAIYAENQNYREIDGELKGTITDVIGTLEKDDYNNFRKINRRHTKARKQLSHVSNHYNLILNLIKIAIYIVSCTLAGYLAIKGKVLIGEYLIFTSFINTIYAHILNLINNIICIKSVEPKVEKVKKLMEVCDAQQECV